MGTVLSTRYPHIRGLFAGGHKKKYDADVSDAVRERARDGQRDANVADGGQQCQQVRLSGRIPLNSSTPTSYLRTVAHRD